MPTSLQSALARIERFVAQVVLSQDAFSQYQSGAVSKEALLPYVEVIRSLSTAYNSHDIQQRIAQPIDSLLAARAYSLYYLPINAAKVLYLLQKIELKNNLRILDFGCGPGTASLALLSFLQEKDLRLSIELCCIDSQTQMLSLARELLQSWLSAYPQYTLSTYPDLRSSPDNAYDLIIIANTLAELTAEQGIELLTDLTAKVTQGGFMILIEPGQPQHTRRLMMLRDRLVESNYNLTPLFPCCRNDSCPMLLNSNTDWCHGYLSWERTKLVSQFDRLLNFNKHRIKFSGFIFQKNGILREGYRVLTEPRRTNAGIEGLVCGTDFYGYLKIKKGARSAQNRIFERSHVFDKIKISKIQNNAIPNDGIVNRKDDYVDP